ncbi:MAG: TnpV protein [Oscillospiraceae bacterium]|nr:TnpV protein [Oscillospiraceae bacterium]
MIIKSETYVYDRTEKRYTYPMYELDTVNRTVVYTDPESYERTTTRFHTEFTKQHLVYVAEYDIGRLKKLVNEGKIINYLEEFEDKCFEVVDNQVEKWKAEDKEYQLAVMNGDIVLAAGLANNLVERAKEIIRNNLIYR